MALSSSEQSVNSVSCNRCGNTISAKISTYEQFHVYCVPCNALMSQELLSMKKKADLLDKENKHLKEKQEDVDNKIAKLKNRTEAVEKAYSDEASDRLEIRSQRDWARNAIMYWKSFLDHWKVKSTCQFCTTNQPCQTMKLIEEQALSATPEWDCEVCKRKEADAAVLRTSVNGWLDGERHARNCGRCIERFESLMSCSTMADLHRTIRNQMAATENSESGTILLNKMTHIIKDFSYLGEGSAIMFDGSSYHVIKLDTRKVRSESVTYLSVASTPKNALDKAKHAQTLETLAHSGGQ